MDSKQMDDCKPSLENGDSMFGDRVLCPLVVRGCARNVHYNKKNEENKVEKDKKGRNGK